MSGKSITLKVSNSARLDKALAEAARVAAADDGLSRMRLQKLIKDGCVTCAGAACRDPDASAKVGAFYRIEVPDAAPCAPKAQAMPLAILFEDDDVVVIDKPSGLVVHPAAGNPDRTLVNALLAHCGVSLSGIGGVIRPGIVHRLDKDTSGLMVVAKNDFAHQALSAQFSDRSLSRVYKAVVWGVLNPPAGEIEGAIGRHPRARQKMAVRARGGKAALTRYKTLEVFKDGTTSLVECRLATGRTHQIRVHMAHKGHPVLGDPLYGGRRGKLVTISRQVLHAFEIVFIHPRSRKKMRFTSPLPQDIQSLIKKLKRGEAL